MSKPDEVSTPDGVYPLEHLPAPDDLSLLLFLWITVRKDGSSVLNGTPEKFEEELRNFLDIERLLAIVNDHREHKVDSFDL